MLNMEKLNKFKSIYPIFIISKGRYISKNTTAEKFEEAKKSYFVIVEPNEYQDYLDNKGEYANILTLPENNQGVAYARNHCFKIALEMGSQYFWQLDDNIKAFRTRIGNKNIKISPVHNMGIIEKEVLRYRNIGGACMMHSVFAWASAEDIKINKMIYCCMLLNTDVKARFIKGTAEDVDFSVQILKEGWCSLLFAKQLIDKPQSGSQKGGCNGKDYSGDGRKKRNIMLVKDHYPWFSEYTHKSGESRVRPSRIWRSFKQRPLKYGEIDNQLSII